MQIVIVKRKPVARLATQNIGPDLHASGRRSKVVVIHGGMERCANHARSQRRWQLLGRTIAAIHTGPAGTENNLDAGVGRKDFLQQADMLKKHMARWRFQDRASARIPVHILMMQHPVEVEVQDQLVAAARGFHGLTLLPPGKDF